MYTAIIVIHILVSIAMIVSVLLQVGKGADMGSAFGGAGSQTLFGSAGPATLLAKVTGVCAGIFMLTSLYLTYQSSRVKQTSVMSDVPAVTAPAAPQATQAQPDALPQPTTNK
ncbi:MAG: preprotein translocase subunit SecG [Deltaproteobacteria bacterium]|nr:preprotein translocase subunit SecG [Deltaproteobacteria bacterium]